MKHQVKAMIVSGYGINCEREMAHACQLAGASADIVHTSMLFNNINELLKYDLIAFPGGFAFGDELGAGKAFANRLSYNMLRTRLKRFVDEGKCIIGICNGFQILVKLGLLPNSGNESEPRQQATLAFNDSGRFEARWAWHKVRISPCVFTKGLDLIYLPIRHGEGKLVCEDSSLPAQLITQNMVPLQYATNDGLSTQSYPQNPNGSPHSIAALCDSTGRLFGMMAHPEACLYFTNDPRWTRKKEEAKRNGKPWPVDGDGVHLFRNAVRYLEENS